MSDKEYLSPNMSKKIAAITKYFTIFAVVLVALLFVKNIFDKKKFKASNVSKAALFQAELNEYETADDLFKVLDFAKVKEWDQNKKNNYIASLEKVSSEHPGSIAAIQANLKLARLHFELGDVEKSKENYLKIVNAKEIQEAKVYQVLACDSLGIISENEKNFQQALKYYEQADALNQIALAPMVKMGKARNLTAIGQKDEAVKVLQEIIDNYPKSSFSDKAKSFQALVSANKIAI